MKLWLTTIYFAIIILMGAGFIIAIGLRLDKNLAWIMIPYLYASINILYPPLLRGFENENN